MFRTYFQETFYDMAVDVAQKYADVIREAIVTGKAFEGEKKQGFFLSRSRGFEDKLFVGNIHRIENRLMWNDEELAEDDQIVNVILLDGPVTRDGDGCSYGSKDHRDQILYANTIPQVVGHIFIINTPGGAASARIDYEQAFADCREKGKPTVAWIDGMCCSAGQLVASLCDRTIVMNGRNTMGCIGTMCAFWGVPNGTVDSDGYRYIELVSITSPDKNAEYREAVDGKTEKLQQELDRLGEEFRETVRQNRPQVKEEHLTGKTFDADEVMGALVDEVGGFDRAIQAVFDLAAGSLTPARELEKIDEEPAEGQEGEEQEDLAALSEQQKAGIRVNAGTDMEMEKGHVSVIVPGPFGHYMKSEIAPPKNDTEMKEEETKAAEAAEQEETPATAQTPDEGEATETPATPDEGEAGQEETPAPAQAPEDGEAAEIPAAPAEGEAAQEEAATENPASVTESAMNGDDVKKTVSYNSKGAISVSHADITSQTSYKEETAEAKKDAGETPAAIADAEAEIDKISETLRNAEALVAERDEEIAELTRQLHDTKAEKLIVEKERETLREKKDDEIDGLNSQLSTLNSQLSEKETAIEKLQKQVAELQAEVKEFSEKPAPMTNSSAGVPADNGTGEAPKAPKQSRIQRGMSYKQIRAAMQE